MIFLRISRMEVLSKFLIVVNILLMGATFGCSSAEHRRTAVSILTSAPIMTDTVGNAKVVADTSVVRIHCINSGSGSGFLHKSGKVITAAHVVAGCNPNKLLIVPSSGEEFRVTQFEADYSRDLAILNPIKPIKGPSMPISTIKEPKIGSLVATWGFPYGYSGYNPLLTVGYLSGVDHVKTDVGVSPLRWVVNAAFNSGNSGGPILNIEEGTVIGVVSSKLAPIPPEIDSALKALSNNRSGFMYTVTYPDGTKTEFSEGQIIAEVLKYLRSQTQLVIGHGVMLGDLRAFLKEKGIDP